MGRHKKSADVEDIFEMFAKIILAGIFLLIGFFKIIKHIVGNIINKKRNKSINQYLTGETSSMITRKLTYSAKRTNIKKKEIRKIIEEIAKDIHLDSYNIFKNFFEMIDMKFFYNKGYLWLFSSFAETKIEKIDNIISAHSFELAILKSQNANYEDDNFNKIPVDKNYYNSILEKLFLLKEHILDNHNDLNLKSEVIYVEDLNGCTEPINYNTENYYFYCLLFNSLRKYAIEQANEKFKYHVKQNVNRIIKEYIIDEEFDVYNQYYLFLLTAYLYDNFSTEEMFKELRDFEGFSSFYKYIKIREKLINLIKIKKEQSEKDNFISNLKNGKKSSTISYDEIINMNGYEFEQLIAELFNGIGYRAEVTKSSGDQGVDVILYKNSERIGIQAKRYTGKVTNKAVQEIVAGVKHYNLDRGIVISTAEYTKSAIELAHSNNIELWGKQKLMDLVKKSS